VRAHTRRSAARRRREITRFELGTPCFSLSLSRIAYENPVEKTRTSVPRALLGRKSPPSENDEKQTRAVSESNTTSGRGIDVVSLTRASLTVAKFKVGRGVLRAVACVCRLVIDIYIYIYLFIYIEWPRSLLFRSTSPTRAFGKSEEKKNTRSFEDEFALLFIC